MDQNKTQEEIKTDEVQKRNQMTITSITILTGSFGDKIILHTDLPAGSWPYTGQACFTEKVAEGSGVTYVTKHFPGIPIEVIDMLKGSIE